jgi:uncharacterized membrane protein YedE/YeeE
MRSPPVTSPRAPNRRSRAGRSQTCDDGPADSWWEAAARYRVTDNVAISIATQRAPSANFPWARLGASVVVLAFLALASLASGDLGTYAVFGLSFGIILQRSRLCFASGFRDLFLLHDAGNLRAILTGLALACVGFAFIQVRAIPTPTLDALPDQAHLFPLGPQLIVGGVLFGLGMVLAGGCVSGTLYRVGEGYVGSVVALAGIVAGLAGANLTWNWWWATFSAHAPTVWLPGLLGYGGAVVLSLAVLSAAYVASVWWELRAGPRPAFGLKRPAEPPAATLGDWLTQRYRALFGRGWPITVGAIALAGLNVIVYLYNGPLGVTGELSNWSDRALSLGGVSVPTLLGASTLSACLGTIGAAGSWLGEGTMLDGGLILGAWLAAMLAGEFKVRFPRQPVRYVQSVGGGLLMGYGAGIAAGCTIGAFFSAVPSLGLNGWVFGLGLLVGSYGGVQIIKKL